MFSKIKTIVMAAFLALLPVAVQAQGPGSIVPSEKHYYTVQMRADKRTVNYARIAFENNRGSEDVATYGFKLPEGVTAQSMTVQQVLAKKMAKTTSGEAEGLEGEQALYDEDFDHYNDMQYGSYRYYNYYDKPDSRFEYSNLDIAEKDEGFYEVTLSQPVKSGKQGSVLISYVAEGVVDGFLGSYSYDYRTLISRATVSSATVAINIDEGLYSRDVKQKRQIESGATTSSSDAAEGMVAPSRSTDRVLFSVARGGVYTKTQTNLLPWDVMSVKGKYAETPFLLYVKEVLITLLIIVVIIGGVIWGRRRYRKKHPKAEKKPEDDFVRPDMTLGSDTSEGELVSTKYMVRVSAASYALALAVAMVAVGVTAVLSQLFDDMPDVLAISSMALAAIGVFMAVTLLPLVYMLPLGVRNVLRWAYVHCVVFACVYAACILLMIVAGASSGGNTYGPYYDSPTYYNSSSY